MLPPENIPIAVAILAIIAVSALLVGVFYSRIDKNAQGQKRLATIAKASSSSGRSARAEDSKRKDIEQALREMEEKQKASRGKRPSLVVRMRQAGLVSGTNTYLIWCILTGLGTFWFISLTSGVGLLSSIGFGIAAGLLGPHVYVSYLRSRRFKLFTKEFPNAIDIIVRGVKSGLPAVDCLRIISVESPEPVRGEFREVVEDQTLGLGLDQAVQRLATRIPLPEAKFFAIVISLQSRTGGNLSDALGGLSKVLRDRRKMQAKIRAMSTEATTSAAIIGILPIGLLLLLSLISPEYMEPMFTTFSGKLLLGGAAFWMTLGCFVMWKMIKFDF